jgi:hypothetical protein
MQATACFHDGIPHSILQEPDRVFHDSIALHSPDGMFDAHADGRDAPVYLLFRWREIPSTRFLRRLEHLHLRQKEALEAFILIQAPSRWQRIACLLSYRLIRCFPFTGEAQIAHMASLIDYQEVFERVTLLLATVILFLLFWIFRTLDRTLRPIVPKRGAGELSFGSCRVRSVANSSAVRAGSRS